MRCDSTLSMRPSIDRRDSAHFSISIAALIRNSRRMSLVPGFVVSSFRGIGSRGGPCGVKHVVNVERTRHVCRSYFYNAECVHIGECRPC